MRYLCSCVHMKYACTCVLLSIHDYIQVSEEREMILNEYDDKCVGVCRMRRSEMLGVLKAVTLLVTKLKTSPSGSGIQ